MTQGLVELPQATMTIRDGAGPIGWAQDIIRLIPGDDTGALVDAAGTAVRTWPAHDRALARIGAPESPAKAPWAAYRGELVVTADPEGRLALVNIISAETMLRGVVPAETFPAAPAAALRAQAVAARNTLFAQLGHRHDNDPFHVCARVHCQVYRGATVEHPRTDAAVRATVGTVLMRRGALVDAVYSASCGGHTEHNNVVWAHEANPALRGVPDQDNAGHAYCGQASLGNGAAFRWQRTIHQKELNALVQTRYPNVGTVLRLEPGPRGVSDRLRSLRIVGDSGQATVHRELPIRRLLGGLRSAAFELHSKHNPNSGAVTMVTIDGKGFGHGVGMCQMGAIGRAEAGQNYQTILRSYYRGARPQTLYGSPHPAMTAQR